METKLLLSALLLTLTSGFAQVPRLSLYEEFTGENCPPCAATNPALDVKLASATNTVLAEFIKWQVPIPSAPSNTWSLYRTNKAEIDWRYRSTGSGGFGYPAQNTASSATTSGVNSAPSGRIDGQHQWQFGGVTSDHPANVTNAMISAAQAITSPFSVIMIKAWDAALTTVNVTVQIVAAKDYTANGQLVFRAVMIERLVQFSVAPGTNGEKTFHNPVIASFPSVQAGTPLSQSWATGQSFSFTLSCAVPTYVRDKNQVDMVGFIQDDGNRKIEQAVRAATCTLQNVNVSSNRASLCPGQSATLTAVGSSGGYSWNNGQTSSSIVVSPSASTNYWVKATGGSNCPNLAALNLKVINCTGINQMDGSPQLVIFPNPNKGEFTIVTGNSDGGSLILFNAIGQKVYEQALDAGENAVKTNLSHGLYYYEIKEGSQNTGTGRLIIE